MGTATRLALAHVSTTAAMAEATATAMKPVDCGEGVGGDDYGSGGGSGNDSSCGDLLLLAEMEVREEVHVPGPAPKSIGCRRATQRNTSCRALQNSCRQQAALA